MKLWEALKAIEDNKKIRETHSEGQCYIHMKQAVEGIGDIYFSWPEEDPGSWNVSKNCQIFNSEKLEVIQ